MAHYDFGYMEGDHLGKPYDLRLLARLAARLRPHGRLILLTAALVLITTGLDLVLPYITRLAIDRYMLPQALEVKLASAPPQLIERLEAAARGEIMRDGQGALFVPEEGWRRLDPRLTAGLRAAGAVARQPWYLAPPGRNSEALAAANPRLFRRADGRVVIAAADLSRLKPAELRALRASDAWALAGLALAFAAAAALALGLVYVQTMTLERAGQEMMFDIRQELYQHILARSMSFFGRNPVGKLATRLTNDVQNLGEMFRVIVTGVFQDSFLLAGIVLAVLLLDARLALACLALTPVIVILTWIFSRLAREAFRQIQGNVGRINSWLSETLTGLSVVKLFGAEESGRQRFEELNQALFRAGLRQIKVFALFMPLVDLLASVAVGLIIWYGGGRVIQDRLSLGTLVAFLAYAQMFFRPVRDLAEKYNILQSAMASGERIFHLLDDQEALPEPLDPAPPLLGPGEVRFENVAFGYDSTAPVVKDVSFTIPPGQTWAVVGPTGAGKTSLVNLLIRFYDPQQGRILLDGVDLRRMTEAERDRRVALVPQENILIAGSVTENISLGRAEVTPERLELALEVSGAAGLVERLEDGLATRLNEGGRDLSAGERQLLALARALAGDPRVLVLDEATSSVDPASERIIQAALPRIMAGRTSLVVAHRLSTVRQADNILVMQKGAVVEQGAHEELMAAGGLYARLVRFEKLKARRG